MICKKCKISEMECDCPQWSPEAIEVMKTRRHHNNKGSRQVKNGKTATQVAGMAKRLGVPFRNGAPCQCEIFETCNQCRGTDRDMSAVLSKGRRVQ